MSFWLLLVVYVALFLVAEWLGHVPKVSSVLGETGPELFIPSTSDQHAPQHCAYCSATLREDSRGRCGNCGAAA